MKNLENQPEYRTDNLPLVYIGDDYPLEDICGTTNFHLDIGAEKQNDTDFCEYYY